MKLRRNPEVCVKEKCERKCLSLWMPEDCSCAVFHALVDVEDGPIQMPRRSGKTTQLIRVAEELMEEGERVYFIVRTFDMGRPIREWFRNRKRKVQIFPLSEILNNGFRGYEKGIVLTDEIRPDEIRVLKTMNAFHFHKFVLGFYT